MPKLYQRKPGGPWHFDFSGPHGRLRRSTGTSDKNLAKRIAAEAEAAEWRRHLDGPEASVTMAQAALAYRKAEKPTRFLERIEDHWRDMPLRQITPGAIRQSAIQLYPDATGATRNRQVIVPTQAIINHAASLGWCKPIKVPRFDVEAKTKEPATRAWVEAFAKHASPHLASLALFMFGTGARIGESVRLTWADVDLNARTATIRVTKPKPWTRTAHLPGPVIAALANIPSNRDPGARVFGYAERGSVKQPWDTVVKRAKIKRLTPHSCRHGFATEMLRAGFDVKTVAAMGGWKDAATVLRTYAHAMEDRTITDALFDTNSAHEPAADAATYQKKRENRR